MNSIYPSPKSSAGLGTVGWREWVSLPQLPVDRVKAKVDTGATTSALHASDLEYFNDGDQLMVRFKIYPLQRDASLTIQAVAPVLEKRSVRNSGGQAQERPVIRTPISFGQQQWEIELTLTNRDLMGFRMLLGREAIRHRFLVDPAGSYLMGAPSGSVADLDEHPLEAIAEPKSP
ncbi:MAG: ATP-dependent zinc protease [Leptolyngbyaceae cyanobacterium]